MQEDDLEVDNEPPGGLWEMKGMLGPAGVRYADCVVGEAEEAEPLLEEEVLPASIVQAQIMREEARKSRGGRTQ